MRFARYFGTGQFVTILPVAIRRQIKTTEAGSKPCAFVWSQKRILFFMERYSVIREKRKREIVLLRGKGCAYKKCAFCDYHTDMCADEHANFMLNKSVLDRVTGEFGELEVINSGSAFELDSATLDYIKAVCAAKGIGIIHFELHYMYRDRCDELRRMFGGFTVKIRLGLETFDRDLRERVWHKGIKDSDPAVISRGFDEANFLFGVKGQTAQSMRRDAETGLKYFERIILNIMCENTTSVVPDKAAIDAFMREVYPAYKDDERVDILINNTDFGVGD